MSFELIHKQFSAEPARPLGEQVRQLSSSILAILTNEGTPGPALDQMLENLHSVLSTRIEETLTDFAAKLRRDLPNWDAAREQLAHLSACTWLPSRQLAAVLLDELNSAEGQAGTILQKVEGLQAFPVHSARITEGPVSEPAIPSEAEQDAPPAAQHVGQELWLRANEHRRKGEYVQAIACFSQLIELCPQSGQAYLKRGQSYYHTGAWDSAVDDLTVALRLMPENGEAFLRRGDAYTQRGDWDRAVADYGSALAIHPKSAIIRHNRAAVFHLQGQHERAIAEFNVILQMDPDYGAAIYNRGLALLSIGDFAKAVADFARSVELFPDDEEVQARLDEALALRDDSSADLGSNDHGAEAPAAATLPEVHAEVPEVDVEVLAPANEAAEPSPEKQELPVSIPERFGSILVAAELPPKKQKAPRCDPAPTMSPPQPQSLARTGSLADATATSPLLPQKSGNAGQVDVICPRCKASGVVRWDRLGAIFVCKGCAGKFCINADGQLKPVSKTKTGKWAETPKPRPILERIGPRRILAGAAAVLFAVIYANWPAAKVESSPVAAPLPQELEPRAELLSKAWLTKDLPLMRRLTLSTHERSVYSWLLRHPPPRVLKEDSLELKHLKMDVHVRGKTGNATNILVRIQGLGSASKAKTIDFVQQWQERDGVWLFMPGDAQAILSQVPSPKWFDPLAFEHAKLPLPVRAPS